MLKDLRYRFTKFMQGRYGVDSLSRFLSVVLIVVILIGMFVRLPLLELITFALLIVPLCIFGFVLSFICLVLRHTLGTVRLAVGVELATLRAGLQEHQSLVSVILMLISIGS